MRTDYLRICRISVIPSEAFLQIADWQTVFGLGSFFGAANNVGAKLGRFLVSYKHHRVERGLFFHIGIIPLIH